MSEKLTRREELELDRRQRDLKRRLSSSDYPPAEPDNSSITVELPDIAEERRPLLQSQKCLHGEHESEGSTISRTATEEGPILKVLLCKYCRCLYVEKA